MKLTVKQMKHVIDHNLIEVCTEEEKKQVFIFAFGKEYMKSKTKGAKVKYQANLDY